MAHEYGPDAVGKTAEWLLETRFSEMVGSISVADIAIIGADRTPPVLDDYSLVPITPRGEWHDSMWPSGYDIRVPADVRVLSEHVGSETAHAIGWAKQNMLLSLSAGGIANNRLRVQQLQGAVRDIDDPVVLEAFRSGIYWEHTLVNAWIAIGRQIGIGEIEVRSAANNPHAQAGGPEILRRAFERYDGTAFDLGFDPMPETGNWLLRL